MTVSISALIGEARRFDTEPAEYAVRLKGAHDLIARLADALESLSAPSGDDEREALALIGNATEDQKQEMILSVIFQRHYIQPIPGNVDDFSECVCGGWSEGAMEPGWDDHLAEVAIAAGFRRPVLLPKEALEQVDYAADAILSRPSPVTRENPVVGAIEAAKVEIAEGRRASVVIDVPDPVTREALKTVADAIRRNCTPDWDAYQSGGDALIAAVADWVENPPEWVTSLRSLPEPAEVEWEYALGANDPEDGSLVVDDSVVYLYPPTERAELDEDWFIVRRPRVSVPEWVPVEKGTEQ